MDIVLIILLLGLVGCGLGFRHCGRMLRRNQDVAAYRLELIRQTNAAAEEDIRNGYLDFMWRYQMFETVTYETMLKQWRRPLDTFYADTRFLRPRPVMTGVGYDA